MIAMGIAKTAEAAGYLPTLYAPAPERLYETVSHVRTAGCCGILTFLYGFLGRQQSDLPVVHIDHPGVIDAAMNLVESNGHQGGRIQAETLLRYGHRDVAYVSPLAGDPRSEGFRDCLAEHGVTDAPARIFVVGSAQTNYRSLLARILARYPNLTGLACFSDDEAAALIRAAHQEGLDLLKKISIIGFGNVREVRDFFHLTTIEQHPMELGAVACQRLVEMIEGQRPSHGLREQCDIELKPGSTVFRVVHAAST
jgi:DNA-binding LacI/PurR family transcriptional regulator